MLITPTAKSKEFTSREALLHSVFQGFKPLTDDSKKGAELKLVNDINRRAGAFAMFNSFLTRVEDLFEGKWSRLFSVALDSPLVQYQL